MKGSPDHINWIAERRNKREQKQYFKETMAENILILMMKDIINLQIQEVQKIQTG